MSIINLSNASIQHDSNNTFQATDSNQQLNLFLTTIEDINKSNEYGWTPLYRTIIASNNKATVELLKIGADPNKTNNMGETPLYQAVEMGNLIQVRILLAHGADPNASKSDGNTPLHCAIQKNNADICHELLCKGSDPNRQNKLYKQTPLHLLLKKEDDEDDCEDKNRYNIAMMLYEYSASPFIKDKYDKTPLDYTKDENMYNIFIREESQMREMDENQNNISIISKGELYMDNMMKYCNTDAYQVQARMEKVMTADSNQQNTIESIKLEQRPKKVEEFTINTSNQPHNNSPCSRNKHNLFNPQSSCIPQQSKNSNSNNKMNIEDQTVSRDVSSINPMEFINQMVTTTNGSAIFSELQENRMSSERQPSQSQVQSQMQSHSHKLSKNSNVDEFTAQDPLMTTPEKLHINSLDNMSYSKSKSIIISELPVQPSSNKKLDHSEHSITYFTVKKLKPEDNSLYKEDSLNKDNYKGILRQKNQNSSSSVISVINLSEKFKDIKSNDDKRAYKKGALLIEHNDLDIDISDINTQDLSQNNYSSSHNNTNAAYNSSTLTNNNNNKNLYTVNSTLPQTQNNNRPNINTNRPNINILQQQHQTKIKNEEDKNNLWLPSTQSYNQQETMILPHNHTKINYSNQSSYNLKQLHKWLCSIDLLCYYNKIVDKNLFDITKFTNGVLKSQSGIYYKNIEEIGIKKPGHIFRLLLKLQSDSMTINQSVLNFLLPHQMIGDARLSQSISDLLLLKDSCCGCVCTENKLMNNLDLDNWLKFKGISHLRENFIHNGFESIEYILIQMFSEYQFTEESLVEHLHMYNMSDRKIVLKQLQLQKKKICEVLGLKYNSLEYEDIESSCQSCSIF